MIRYIYTFFVGIFLAIVVSMGLALFYPAPTGPESPNFYNKELTSQQLKTLQAFESKQKAYEKSLWHYNRNASMILLICAVTILTIALSFGRQLGMLADGILLGGIFNLVYAIGRGMDTNSDKYRFLVASVGLAVTLLLGYMKFAKPIYPGARH